jgi:signal peptidase II
MKKKYLLVSSIMGMVVLLDQITKYMIEKNVKQYQVISIIPGFFNITHVRNKGAAFSLFASAPESFRSLFFTIVTIVAIIVIFIMIRKTHERLMLVSLSLIAGGAVGNLVDRVRYGEVVDFIQWYVKSYYWPSFNVADSAITVGVCLLAIDMLFQTPEKARRNRPTDH